MKIAVTSKGTNLDAEVDPRFGRGAYFLVIDTETLDFEVLDNTENVNAFKGAGIQAAKMISDKGVQILLTGYCGPNAFKALQAANIKVAVDVTGTVREAVKACRDGGLNFTNKATMQN
jgi:predicted Fe-Mo cluster-binding NifX family protein